ncbi:MAG: hypothetical protein ABJL99_09810 [Aliishimia sp.]
MKIHSGTCKPAITGNAQPWNGDSCPVFLQAYDLTKATLFAANASADDWPEDGQ